MKILLSVNAGIENPDVLASELGFDGVEYVMPLRIDTSQPTALVAPLLTAAETIIVHGPKDYYDYPRFCKAVRDAAAVARVIGARAVNMHPGSTFFRFGGRANVERCIAALKRVSSIAGMRICYEVLAPPKPGNLCHLKQQAYSHPDQWAEDVDRFDLYATLDVTHLAGWRVNPIDYIERLGTRIKLVHLSDFCFQSDKDHRSIGEGRLPIGEILLAIMRYCNDSVAVTLELSRDYQGPNFAQIAQKNLNFIRTAIA